MKKSVELLKKHIENIEKIILQFSVDEKIAVSMLAELKMQLGEVPPLNDDEKEMYEPAVYNALATINTAPISNKKNAQLLDALVDAKEELIVISEMI